MEKSRKLRLEEQQATDTTVADAAELIPLAVTPPGPVRIKPLETLNDWIVILQTETQTTIHMAAKLLQNEGYVIGVPGAGCGLPDGAGGRTPTQVKIGDYVVFGANAVALKLEPTSGFYKGKTIVTVNERNLLIRKRPRPFQLEDQDDDGTL